MSRTLSNRNRTLGVVVLAGTLGAVGVLGGCGGKGSGGSVRAGDTSTPVNAGLSSLKNRPGLALPSDEELMELSVEEASMQERIAESARQLEFYFTNVEIDGPADLPADDETMRETIAAQAEELARRLRLAGKRVAPPMVKGSIGKRYLMEDKSGTPYCVTVDDRTSEDNTVTVRLRDTGEQVRAHVDEVVQGQHPVA